MTTSGNIEKRQCLDLTSHRIINASRNTVSFKLKVDYFARQYSDAIHAAYVSSRTQRRSRLWNRLKYVSTRFKACLFRHTSI